MARATCDGYLMAVTDLVLRRQGRGQANARLCVPPTVTITTPTPANYVNIANQTSVTVSGACSDGGQQVAISGSASGAATCQGGEYSVNLDFSAKLPPLVLS